MRLKVRHRSIKSKPGALRRKEIIVKGEMERFGASMARLSGVAPAPPAATPRAEAQVDCQAQQHLARPQQPPAVAGRWAALRGYISATMEQAPAFVDN